MELDEKHHVQTLIKGFQKLESEISDLRANLTGKIDASIVTLKENAGLDDLKDDVLKLASVLESNRKDIATVDKKLDEILHLHKADKSILNDDQVENLSVKVADATIKNIKLDDIAVAIRELKQDVNKIEKKDDSLARNEVILGKLEEVKATSDTISKDVTKLGNSFDIETFKEVANNTSLSLDALNKMNTNIESLVDSLVDTPIKNRPKKPKEREEKEEEATSKEKDEETLKEKEEETSKGARRKVDVKAVDDDKITEIRIRDALLFSDSIALKCDIERLEENLHCNIKTVPTYHIEQNPDSPDKNLFLRALLESELKDAKVDFAIISVGTNDISALNIDEETGILINTACDQTKNLVHMVDSLQESSTSIYLSLKGYPDVMLRTIQNLLEAC